MKKLGLLMMLIAGAFSSTAGEIKSEKENRSFLNAGDGGKSFDEGTHIINAGVGFGGRSYHSLYKGAKSSYGRTPAFSISYEQPWPKRIGPGYLGVGALFAFQHEYNNYDYDYAYISTSTGFAYKTYYYHHKWSYYTIAGRAAYHWDVLNSEKAEVYAGVIIGLRSQTHSYDTNDPGKNDPYGYSEGVVYPAYNVFAGARWYFAK